MTIYNLGSINADLFYRLPHFPGPGETLASTAHWRGLGGKGTNMSVAAARAASRVVHIGAVGADGKWAVDRLMEYGVDTTRIATLPDPTGHAIVMLDAAGENSIVLAPGANHAIPPDLLVQAMAAATESDTFLFQNETSAQRSGAEIASARGMRVAYAAAPFDADAVAAVLPLLDLLILNEVEAAQLASATGQSVETLPVRDVVVTLGTKGARWINTDRGAGFDVPAIPVTPVDTTGAGDTFTGYLVAGLDRGMPMKQALSLATRAAALMVTRQGTADVIPDLKEVHELRADE